MYEYKVFGVVKFKGKALGRRRITDYVKAYTHADATRKAKAINARWNKWNKDKRYKAVVVAVKKA